jgi:hypothetical protein
MPNLWIDPASPTQLMMFGGFEPQAGFAPELWSYDLGKDVWTNLADLSAPVLAGGRVAPVPGERAVMFVDGYSGWSGTETVFNAFRVDYGGEAITMSALPSEDAPTTGSLAGAFVYVSHLDRHLAACGLAESGAHCEVTMYDRSTGTWERPIIEGERPEGRYGFAYAYDVETKRLIIFSGGRDGTPTDPVNAATDTWALDLSDTPFRWTRLAEGGPPPRRNSCSALDERGHRMIVWSGTPDAAVVLDGVYALDLDLGNERWEEIDAGLPPPARSSGASTYDAAKGRIIVGFGNTTGALFTDLHALNL